MVAQAILTLNAGSSSIKFALFALDGDALECTAGGKIEGIGTSPHLVARDAGGKLLSEYRWDDGAELQHEAFFGRLFDFAEQHLDGATLLGVGHRVVHGGAHLQAPARVTPSLLGALQALVPLAPLHQPHNLSAIEAVAKLRPELAQVVCFDTAFHHSMPSEASRFALPPALTSEGIRRYGFHGISYEYIAGQLGRIDPDLAGGRTIIAHLGNGASLCALHAGRSIDTTMSFTTLDGLVMGTRCGGIDPGVLLYLLQHKRMTPSQLSNLFYDQSGLLGVSGLSSDMRELLASKDSRAAEAVDLFVYRLVREIGGMVSVLGGLDGLVFTAGIGENAAEIRHRVCQRLAWLGLVLDEQANAAHAAVISAADSRLTVRVMATDEEAMIAQHTCQVLGQPV